MPRLIGAAQAVTTDTQAEQITTFTSSGTLTTQPRTTSLQYLVVAGGGAGGFKTATSFSIGASFTVTVGGTPAIAGDYIPLTLVSNNVALPGVTFASAGKDSSNNCEIQIA